MRWFRVYSVSISNPVADRMHLIVAGLHPIHDVSREIAEPVRLTITAWEQIRQNRIGQILNLHKDSTRGLIHSHPQS